METPPTDSMPGETVAEAPRSRVPRAHTVVWGALTAALIGYIAFGSVSAISYTYYAFSGRLVQLSPQRSLVDIWRDAIAELPAFSIGWLPGVLMIGSLATVVLCAIGGAWLLLVRAPSARPRSTRAE